MPGYRTHLAGGAVTGGAALLLLACIGCFPQDYWLALALIGAACAGSLFPDIDVKSKGQHYFYWVLLALFAYYMLYNKLYHCAGIGLIAILPLLTRHRGILHNVWFLLLLTLVCMLQVQWYCTPYAPVMCSLLFFFLLGMISHLWLDMGLRRMLRL